MNINENSHTHFKLRSSSERFHQGTNDNVQTMIDETPWKGFERITTTILTTITNYK